MASPSGIRSPWRSRPGCSASARSWPPWCPPAGPPPSRRCPRCAPNKRGRESLTLPAMRKLTVGVMVLAGAVLIAQSAPQHPAETLLDRSILKALDDELSGVAAKDHVARLTGMHRVPASSGFHDAIEYVMARAKAFGLADVHVETYPGDG